MNNQRFKEAERMYKKVKTHNNINKDPGQRHQFICFFPPTHPMYVCLFVWGLLSHLRIFHSYGDITIAAILTYARPLSSEGASSTVTRGIHL